jgi:small subunit ribosomal protein S7
VAGKKSTAEGIFYEALTKMEAKGGDEALKLFKKAIENAKPLLEVKSRLPQVGWVVLTVRND